MQPRYRDQTFDEFCRLMATGEVFSMARYGDGERQWLLGDNLVNCDGHGGHPDAAEALKQSLLRWRGREQGRFYPQVRMVFDRKLPDGITEHPWADWDRRFWAWMCENDLGHLVMTTHFAPVFGLMDSVEQGVEFPLLPILRRLPVVLVGPEYLMRPVEHRGQRPTRPLSSVFPIRHFIPVAAKNCWLDHERVREELERIHRDDTARPLCVLLSCSLLSNVLIGELHDTVGQDSWLIDTGSLWDPFVGVVTRCYHTPITPKLQKLLGAGCGL